MAPDTAKSTPFHLDGSILEGGGQLIRIAIALSAITSRPLNITRIRNNRKGKKGLKNSHLAAIRFLASVSNSTVKGAELGSTTLSFTPPPATTGKSGPIVQREYYIRMDTPGSVFLVFQALYPYLVRAGAMARLDGVIRVSITGGTNVSMAPSIDYIKQVLVPNFRRVGLPGLEVEVRKRGWGLGKEALGTVNCYVRPLEAEAPRVDGMVDYGFPLINLDEYRRGEITKMDITVLAPDDVVASDGEDNLTIRGFIEQETIHELRRRLSELPPSVFQTNSSPSDSDTEAVPIQIHTSECTRNISHVYLLITAHTSIGFVLGRDALLSEIRKATSHFQYKTSKHHHKKSKSTLQTDTNGIEHLQALVERCISRFLKELYNPHLEGQHGGKVTHKPCVDVYMRDQLAIFEALGRASTGMRGDKESTTTSVEDQRYWSLHTQTARWVCQEVLGVV